MTYRRLPDDAAVRPVIVGDEDQPAAPEPRRSFGKFAVVLAALGGVVAGFLIGLVARSDDATPPPEAAVAVTAQTVPAPTTSVTTTIPPGVPELPPTLGDLVPGLDGTLQASVGSAPGDVLVWPTAAIEGAEIGLPVGAAGVSWDASGRWAASQALAFNEDTLFLGPIESLQPAFADTTTYAWHPSDEGRIAWIGDPVGEGLALATGSVSATGLNIRPVTLGDTTLDRDDRLIAWGDWGFVLEQRTGEGTHLVTLAPDGSALGDLAGLSVVGVRPDGAILVHPSSPDLSSPASLTDPALDVFEPVPWAISPRVLWSHNGAISAQVVPSAFGAALEIRGATFDSQILLDSDRAIPLGWSPDDRFVLVGAADAQRRRGSPDPEVPGPALILVDTTDRSVHILAVSGLVLEAAVELAG